jgi:deoxyribodipyrimidine photo-lyase
MNVLLWLRADLRLRDNPALRHACEEGSVIAAFLISPAQWVAHDEAPLKVDFWLRNLSVLSDELAELNIPLKFIHADRWHTAPQAVTDFCLANQIRSVHVNAEWGINERRRDGAVAEQIERHGVRWTAHHGATLLIPGTVVTGKGDCYQVFTPFAKRCRDILRSALPHSACTPSAQPHIGIRADAVPAHLPPFITPAPDCRALWPAGATAAIDRPLEFTDGVIDHYDHDRDLPALDGTSRLSPYLAAGVISPVQCLRAALAANHGELDSGKAGIRTWIDELLWREFYLHLLAATPGLSMHQPMRPETVAVPWRDAPNELHAWQQGKTGIPIIDAAMRQLLGQGWMHNRLRMLTAMFLSKNLLIDWRLGEAWFMQHLIDGDLASNNGGWQWSASTGADAAPYFRVFNPLTQSRKFDPDGAFLARWLPELAGLPAQARHDPTPLERAQTGYPRAIVDLGETRLRAIDAFKGLRAEVEVRSR